MGGWGEVAANIANGATLISGRNFIGALMSGYIVGWIGLNGDVVGKGEKEDRGGFIGSQWDNRDSMPAAWERWR